MKDPRERFRREAAKAAFERSKRAQEAETDKDWEVDKTIREFNVGRAQEKQPSTPQDACLARDAARSEARGGTHFSAAAPGILSALRQERNQHWNATAVRTIRVRAELSRQEAFLHAGLPPEAEGDQ